MDDIKPITPLHGQIGMINLLTGPDEEGGEHETKESEFLTSGSELRAG